MSYWILINQHTGEIVAHTIYYDCDIEVEDILDYRSIDAIDYDVIPIADYIWREVESEKQLAGVLI